MNKSSKIFTIIQHEYITKVKSKGFIIGTILGPLAIVFLIGAVVVVTMLSVDTGIKKIAVLDKFGKFGSKMVASDTARYFLTNLKEAELKEQVRNEEIDGFLIIPENIMETNTASVYTRGGGGIGFVEAIESSVEHFARIERLKNAGLNTDVIDIVEKGISIETEKVTEQGVQKDHTEAFAVLGYVLGFAIYMFMFIYGSFVSRGVIEEKANRIIEVIASSAKPFQIMMGKVVGIGLVGLTQVLFWILLMFVIVFAGQPLLTSLISEPTLVTKGMMTPEQMEIQQQFGMAKDFLSSGILIGFLFYFLSGYFVYSTIFAAIGSAVDQEQDAQQLMTPISMLIVIPMLFISVVMTNPDSTVSVILSLVPFFTPILMIVRVAATQVPFWQVSLSVVLMIATFFGCIWVASRIYRVGILMYGKKPSIKDLIKWIRLAK